jgi:transmembrane sensor
MRYAFEESDLLRLVEGDCSPDEAARLQAWVAADPGRSRLLDELDAVWRATGTGTRRWDIGAARNRLDHARFPIGTVWRLRAAVAAGVLLAIAAAWQFFPRGHRAQEYVTAAGQRVPHAFADGTRFILGPSSRLRVRGDYGVGGRIVELEGEAYFVVQHDPIQPFVVRTALGIVEDLGTEFSVRAYRGEPLEVVVVAGEVSLRATSEASSVTLGPRDRGVLDARGVPTRYPPWTGGRLVLDGERLDSVLERLARASGLQIALNDSSLAQQRVTLTLDPKSVNDVLHALAGALNLELAVAGKSACLSSPPPSLLGPGYPVAASGWRCPDHPPESDLR